MLAYLLSRLVPFVSLCLTSLILAAPIADTKRADQMTSDPHLSSPFQVDGADCVDYTIPLSVSVDGYRYIGPRWTDNYGLIDYVTRQSGRRPYDKTELWEGNVTSGGDFEISATMCTPTDTSAGKSKHLLLASHGLWFDRSYWNIPHEPGTYNFARRAIAHGYSVFFYDRLGVGLSSKISGFDAQALVHVDILAQLAKLVKSGQYTSGIGQPDKLVLVSHAFASFLTAQLVQRDPEAADAVLLQTIGTLLNGPVFGEAAASRIAASQRPDEFGYADPGYLTWADELVNINLNFKQGYYTLDAVDHLERTKTPYSPFEPATQGFLNINATDFSGPTLIIDGETSFTVCNGYCPDVVDSTFRPIWRSATPFETYIPEGCGHALNLCTGAPDVFAKMFGFLAENGL